MDLPQGFPERVAFAFRDYIQRWPFNALTTFAIFLPTTLGFIVLLLQSRRLSQLQAALPQGTEPGPSCDHCGTVKPREVLKRCGKCHDSLYCDESCQRAAFPAHKQVCGVWKEPKKVDGELPKGTTRVALENNMKLWCDYHRRLLMYATIQSLSLPRHPSNSTKLLLLVSITFQPPSSPSVPVAQLFTLADVTPLEVGRFRESNPGMATAFSEVEKMRQDVQSKGGEGVALLLVRCGPVVQVRFRSISGMLSSETLKNEQVVPVGLPSPKDLEAIPPDKEWKPRLTDAIEKGVQLA